MEPVIKNYRKHYQTGGPAARLINLDDSPPTCTLSYSHIAPGATSSHHIHPWEHEVYIIQGSGTLICDGKEYPVKARDAMYIPANTDHYTLNNGGEGDIIRIEINPLVAAQSGGAQNNGGTGTGEPPVIKSLDDLDTSPGAARPILTTEDGPSNYTLSHRGMADGQVSPEHIHPAEHLAYVIEGGCVLTCDGKDINISEGDAILIPPNVAHEWSRSTGPVANWLVFNPVNRG